MASHDAQFIIIVVYILVLVLPQRPIEKSADNDNMQVNAKLEASPQMVRLVSNTRRPDLINTPVGKALSEAIASNLYASRELCEALQTLLDDSTNRVVIDSVPGLLGTYIRSLGEEQVASDQLLRAALSYLDNMERQGIDLKEALFWRFLYWNCLTPNPNNLSTAEDDMLSGSETSVAGKSDVSTTYRNGPGKL